MANEWKILLMVVMGLFLFPLASAFEFDNVGDYYPETRTMEITNLFGLGSPIANITLLSPLDVKVIYGEERLVAWYEIDNFGSYDGNEIFDIVDTYDLQRGNSEVQKNIKYKLQKIELIEVPNYVQVCNSSTADNLDGCGFFQKGTKELEQIEWQAFNPNSDLLEGTVVIGLFTEVEVGEKVEWIPDMFGVRIEEWATWTESLNEGIVAYYKMDETSGTVAENSVNSLNNMTLHNGATFDSFGKIGYTSIYDGVNDIGNLTELGDTLTLEAGFTISFWTKGTAAASHNLIGNGAGTGGAFNGFKTEWATGGYHYYHGSGGAILSAGQIPVPNEVWTFVVLGYEPTTNAFWAYMNNTLIFNATTGSINSPTGHFRVAAPVPLSDPTKFFPGKIDELGIWDRTLTTTEITQIWNDNAGVQYVGIFNEPPVVTLNTPSNNSAETGSTVTLNCSALDGAIGGATTEAISLYINGSWVETNTGSSDYLDIQTTQSLGQGSYNWTCNATDDEGLSAWASGNFSFTVTDGPPTITLNTPPDNMITSSVSPVTMNCSALDAFGTTSSIAMYLNGSWLASNSGVADYLDVQTSQSLGVGSYNWTCNATDNLAQSGFAAANYSFTVVHPLEVNLTSPATASTFLNASYQIFNATSLPRYSSLVNATLYIWNSSSTVLNKTTIPLTGITSNESSWNVSIPQVGTGFLWNVLTCVTNTTNLCAFDTANFTFSSTYFTENSQSFNKTSYETLPEAFKLNLTLAVGTSITAEFFYNGTSDGDATQVADEFISTKETPTITGGTQNHTFYWQLNDGSSKTNTSLGSHIVNATIFGLCNTTLTTPFINFTFKDEGTDTFMGAFVDASTWYYYLGSGAINKSYTYSNPSQSNLTYTFCAKPADKIFLGSTPSFKYSNTSYPQRTWTDKSWSLINTTTQQTLYLLSSADGIYTSINVVESTGVVISGVEVTIERQVNNLWVTIGQAITGSDGLVTFWVNPNFQHRITAIKTGFANAQVTITPSQSLYTLTMSTTGSSAGSYNDTIDGVSWTLWPASGGLSNISQSFNATIIGSLNLENCMLQILNATNISQVFATSTSITNSSYCQPILTYKPIYNTKIFGRLSVDTTSTSGFVILDSDWKWYIIDQNSTIGYRGIKSFFSNLNEISDFGTGNEAEFTKFVLFFLVTTILLGAFMYFTGVEFSSPGMSLSLIWIVVLIASAGGFLTFDSGADPVSDFIEQWGFAIFISCLNLGYLANLWRIQNR